MSLLPVPTVSVVIPVRDEADLLAQQLACVASQVCDRAFEIVVADNGRDPDVADVVVGFAHRDQRIRLVDAAARPGPAAARNVGAAAAHGALLAFCDADDLVEPGWLAALTDGLDRSDVVVGHIDFGILNGGAARGPRSPTPFQYRYLPAGLGANLGLRRDCFTLLGGFDEELTAGEDIDLCWRGQEAGYRFAEVPAAVVAKRDRTSSRRRAHQALAYGRCDAALYRRHRRHGMPRNAGLALKTWLWLVVNLPLLGIRHRRRMWAHALGLRTGRLLGSARHRVIFL